MQTAVPVVHVHCASFVEQGPDQEHDVLLADGQVFSIFWKYIGDIGGRLYQSRFWAENNIHQNFELAIAFTAQKEFYSIPRLLEWDVLPKD